MLPRPRTGLTDAELSALGVVFGVVHDDLFIEAQLPAGWQKATVDDFPDTIIILDADSTPRASCVVKDGAGRGARLVWYPAADAAALADDAAAASATREADALVGDDAE